MAEIDKRRHELVAYEIQFFQEQLIELEKETLELEATIKSKKFRLEAMRKRLRELKIRVDDFLNEKPITRQSEIDGI